MVWPAKLIYLVIASLDGYIEDAAGTFGWVAPDEAVHAFVNGLERPVGTYLYGRRMYETMVFVRRWAEVLEENRQRLDFYREHLQHEPEEAELQDMLGKYMPAEEVSPTTGNASVARYQGVET
jgi:dihydrofolate reductase